MFICVITDKPKIIAIVSFSIIFNERVTFQIFLLAKFTVMLQSVLAVFLLLLFVDIFRKFISIRYSAIALSILFHFILFYFYLFVHLSYFVCLFIFVFIICVPLIRS